MSGFVFASQDSLRSFCLSGRNDGTGACDVFLFASQDSLRLFCLVEA